MSDVRNPLFGWWEFTREFIEALTIPADAEACDREVERLSRESWLGSVAVGAANSIGGQWRRSRSRGLAKKLVGLVPASAVAAIRAAGWATTVASVTTLVLNAVKPIPPGPLTWLVPVAAGVAGLLLMTAASRLARGSASV